MLPQYYCFDETIDPDKHADNNVYRWVLQDLTHYKSTPASLYKKYVECLEKHPVTTTNTVEFSNCYGDKVEKEEHLEIVTRNWAVPSKEEVKAYWKECESLVAPEVIESLKKGETNEESTPFLKCVMEKTNVVVNDCFYVQRDIKINNLFSEKDNSVEIKKCYRSAIGKEKIDPAKYISCIHNLIVI